MRTSRLVRAVNWRYAVGEVLLIVIGVSIALAISSWWEYRQARNDEAKILLQFEQTINGDIERMQGAVSAFESMDEGIVNLIKLLERGASYTPDMDNLFGSCAGWNQSTLNRGPYEVLKSKGFDLISSETLRMNLVDYYDTQSALLEITGDENRVYNRDIVLPYFVKNFLIFRDLELTAVPCNETGSCYKRQRPIKPINYDALSADPYFINICLSKLDNMANWVLPTYRSTIAIAESLLADIAIEIEFLH